jgi:hypothetical protein
MIDRSKRRIETFLLIRRLQIFRSAEDFETVGDLNAQTQDDEPRNELESSGHDFGNRLKDCRSVQALEHF